MNKQRKQRFVVIVTTGRYDWRCYGIFNTFKEAEGFAKGQPEYHSNSEGCWVQPITNVDKFGAVESDDEPPNSGDDYAQRAEWQARR